MELPKKKTAQLSRQLEVLWKLAQAQRKEPLELMGELQRVLRIAADFLPVSRASIWLYRNNHNSLQRLCLFDNGKERVAGGVQLTAQQYPAFFSACSKRLYLAIDDVSTDPSTAELQVDYLNNKEIKSLLNVALYLGTNLKGMLSFEHVGEQRHWASEDLNFARAIANRINLALADQEREEAISFELGLESASKATLVISAWGNVEKVNYKTEELFGYTRSQLLKMHVNQIIPDIMVPDGTVSQIFKTKDPHQKFDDEIKAMAKNKNGDEFPVEFSVSKVSQWHGDHALILLSDVTLRYEKARKLEEREELYRSLVEDQIDCILRVVPGGEIVLANNGFCRLFGLSKEQAVTKSIYEIVPETEHPLFLNAVEDISPTNPMVQCTHKVIAAGRVERTLSWIARGIFDNEGKLLSYQVIGRDVTQETDREDRLRKSQRLESLALLAGGMAHDFNNLLSPILSFTDMALVNLPQDTPELEYLKYVMEAANKAKELTRMVLVFSRQDEHLDRTAINVSACAQEILTLIQSLTPSRIKLQQQVDNDCGMIQAHPSDFYQILTNLCTNAVQAMPAGGELLVYCVNVIRDKKKCLQIEVKDTGEGIRPELMTHLFEPFFTTRTNGEGTGMGLAVVKGLVQELGGDIACQSDTDKGTAFVIYLPIIQDEELAGGTLPSDSLILGKEAILVVDDDINVAALTRKGLVRLGYSVTIRTSAEEALALVAEPTQQFDIVITDFTMPYMTGLELSSKIQKINPALPIILMSGYGRLLSKCELKENGITLGIQKPFVAEELASCVRQALSGLEV